MVNQQVLEMDCARSTQFEAAAEKLKAEHEALAERLASMKQYSAKLADPADPMWENTYLPRLKQDLSQFMRLLKEHTSWAEKDLFPMLMSYFNKQMLPSMQPSIWVMEKDHEIADSFVNALLQTLEHNHASMLSSHKFTTGQFKQAYRMLQEHLDLEKDIIHPMVDQVLYDIDSLFS